MNRLVRRLAPLGLFALVLLPAAGCGNDGIGKRYSVYGTVTYKGEPVPKGTITFTPDDATTGRVATGTIENGEYELSTAGQNDGALPGSYKIKIVAVEVDNTGVLAKAEGGAGRQDDVIAANQSGKKLIPAKYELEATSGLTRTVEEKSNEFDFDLTD